MTLKLTLAVGKEAEDQDSIEANKAAEDLAAQEEVCLPAQSDDLPDEKSGLDLTATATDPVEHGPDASNAEPSSDLPQEEASSSPDIMTTADTPVEEELVAVPTESTSEASEQDNPSEPFTPSAADAVDATAQESESVPGGDESKDADQRASEPDIEATKVSVRQMTAPESSVPEEALKIADQEDNHPDSGPDVQEEPVDSPLHLESDSQDVDANDIAVAETPGPSDDNPSSTDQAPQDVPDGGQASDHIPEEPSSAAEIAAAQVDTEPTVVTIIAESDDTGLVAISPESEDTPSSAPVEASGDPDDFVQILDVSNEESADDTAAIAVVPPSDDTAAIIVPPPPSSPGSRVTIVEPVKPPKGSKKKTNSSKSSKSRITEKPMEKPVEKPVEIIMLREGKSKTVGTGKSRKKTKSAPRKAGKEAADLVPPPPPATIDIPPRAPSPPPSGTVIDIGGDEEMQVIDGCAAGVDTQTLPGAESADIKSAEAGEISTVAEQDQENAHAARSEQKEDVTQANALPPAEVEAIVSPLENGDGREEAVSGADVKDQLSLTHEETDSSPPEAEHIPEEPQVASPSDDNPPHDLPPKDDPPNDESSIAEPVTTESENHDEPELVTAEEQTEDALMAESPVEENGETESSPALGLGPLAQGEPEGLENSAADVSGNTVVPSDHTGNGLDEAESQNPSIEAAGPEQSISEEGPQEVPSAETIEADPAEHVPNQDEPNESAPTLLELAALILPGDPVPELTEDTAVPECVPAEVDVSTMEPATAVETSDPSPEVTVGEDNDLNEQAVVIVRPDEEDVLDVPPEAPMPPETDSVLRVDSGDEVEASQCQETEEMCAGAESEDTQPELSQEVVAPVEAIGGDQEARAETDTSEKVVIGEDANRLDSDAKTWEADFSAAPADPDVLVQRGSEASEPNADAAMVAAPRVSELQELDTSPPAVEEPDAVETAEALRESPDQRPEGASKDWVERLSAPTSEEGEEALAESVLDPGFQDLATAATAEESVEGVGATTSPASISEDKTEAVQPAKELQEVVLAETEIGAEEVASELVIESVEVEKSIDEEASTEHVTEEPAADEAEDVVVPDPDSEQASEPLVVESVDEATETAEEHVFTEPSRSSDTKDLSEQPIAPALEYISAKEDDAAVNNIDIINNASTTTTGVGTETKDHDVPMLSMPVLAEEAQIVEGIESPKGVAEDISRSEEEKTTKAPELVDKSPLHDDTPGSNETSSPGEQPIPPTEEHAADVPRSSEPAGSDQEPDGAAQSEPPAQESSTEAEVLPGDSASQQSRVQTLPDSEPGPNSASIEEPALEQPGAAEDSALPPSKHSSRVSFDEPPVAPQSREPSSPTKERRKSSKSSSNRHGSSRHKVKDVSSTPADPKLAHPPTQPRRRSSTVNAPPPGLFRTPSTTKPRLTRAELAEQAEIRRRAAEIAAREQEVHRQLERARKRAALGEQEKRLRQKEEELARLQAVEREKKRAKREEHKRRAQEALEQERAAREKAEEEARQKQFERAERRKRRKEAEASGSRRHRDDRPRAHRRSTSHRESEARRPSPTPVPKVSRHRMEDIGAERQRSRDEYHVREAAAESSRDSEQRRHRRSTHRDLDRDEKPKKGFWKSILGRI